MPVLAMLIALAVGQTQPVNTPVSEYSPKGSWMAGNVVEGGNSVINWSDPGLAARWQITYPPSKSGSQGFSPQGLVTTSARFCPLTHGVRLRQRDGHSLTQQDTDRVLCSFKPTVGFSTKYRVLKYAWSGIDTGSKASDIPTISGYFHVPGIYVVTCTITAEARKKNATERITAKFTSKPVYVIGGPIRASAILTETLSPSEDAPPLGAKPILFGPSEYFMPKYIEYFGFDPNKVQPPGTQMPQEGLFSPESPQPPGTTVHWRLGPGLEFASGFDAWMTGVNVWATRGFKGHPVGAACTYSFSNGSTVDPVSGSCRDDSANTVQVDGQLHPMYYQFDSHEPASIKLVSPNPTFIQTGEAPAYKNESVFTYQLLDATQKPMPGVQVSIRFPQNGSWNIASARWRTDAQGKFTDHIYYMSRTSNSNPKPGLPLIQFLNDFYVATTDTTYGSKGGLFLMKTLTEVWTNQVSNDQIPSEGP